MLNEEGVLYVYMCACLCVCVHVPVGNPVNHYCVFCMCARVYVSVCVCFMSPGRLVLACSTTVWIRGESSGVALCFNLELMTEPPAFLAILPILSSIYPSICSLLPPLPSKRISASSNKPPNSHCSLSPFHSLPQLACFFPLLLPSLSFLLSSPCFLLLPTVCRLPLPAS